MLNIIKDDFDETPEDIMDTINRMLNNEENKESKEKIKKENNKK